MVADPNPLPPYIGRFAPSPTGPLHMGSLVAALASYLDARQQDGQWLMRVEDLDPPREIPGATASILNSLEAHGMHWDGEVMYQSHRAHHYETAAQQLIDAGLTFWCQCSRRDLADEDVYPGTCRQRMLMSSAAANGATARSLRVKVADRDICFHDAIQGRFCQNLATEVGDFVIQRKDHLFAYQLAVVVDDAAQHITHVIRGADLLDSTPRQIHLQQLLGLPTPRYGHIPVLINALGQKLSKQHHAPAIDNSRAAQNLCEALSRLRQTLPPLQLRRTPAEILRWAIANWDINKIPPQTQLPDQPSDHS